ncbi:hypothetical protein CISIN_1g038649mg [Citrus sinensis]|uniref:Uracil-DNA glycosylase-like domain-containing protein n=1 Tax=Citrus sinensis TaxID=2711 RepID=A0A067ERK9_CITSI|nr:hypothetical protein CISIN_1g038649mg [Citrus sinensis]
MLAWVKSLSGTSMLVEDFATFIEPLKLLFHDNHCSGWRHQANSHAKKGWEQFTDAVIKAISDKKEGVVFLLWGNSAQEKSRLINVTKHHILKAAHPSGLSANRGFFGCRHFSRTNQILEQMGMTPIDWQL